MNQTLNQILDSYEDEMIEKLQALIRFKSIVSEGDSEKPFGEEIQKALEYMLALGEEKGFSCRNFDNYAAELTLGTECQSIGIVTHLDVVPEGGGWQHDPYGGEIYDGKIYGRGAVDDKGPVIAAFYACLAILESGLPLKRSIKHILGTNEESGSFPCIEYYKTKADMPICGLVPDSWFPVAYAEKGFYNYIYDRSFEGAQEGEICLLALSGGEAFNVVAPFAQAKIKVAKNRIKEVKEILHCCQEAEGFEAAWEGDILTLTVCGKAAHASTPHLGKNAISVLLQILRTIKFDSKELADTLQGLAVAVGSDSDGFGLGISYEDHTGALTNNVGTILWKESCLSVKMNLRSPITFEKDLLCEKLSQGAERIGMSHTLFSHSPHFYIERETPLVQTLCAVYKAYTGDEQSKPVAHGGGSYARILKNFVPFGPSMQKEELVFHKQDEYITCQRLLLLSKIYAEALYRLATEEEVRGDE